MAKLYKTIRQGRYEDLRSVGFLNWEARILSKVPRSIPYLKTMVAERQVVFKTAQKKGLTEAEYGRRIQSSYIMKGYAKAKQAKSAGAVYAMLRHYEEDYKPKHKEYSSPWVKKHKDFSVYSSKIDKKMVTEFNDWRRQQNRRKRA